MDVGEAIAILAAGFAAGTINAAVGSGTLITFPVLLALGYAPVVANVSNGTGLVFGGAAGAFGYRRELRGQRARALRLGSASLLGAVAGAIALLTLPESAFEAIVPAFIAVALALIVLQPRITRALARRRDPAADGDAEATKREGRGAMRATQGEGTAAWLGVLVTGVYGGYFGAAQGIMLLAVLGLALSQEPLQRVNGLKNVLATTANSASALIFVFAADIDWGVVALIAAGSIAGGTIGARYGRLLPPVALRGLIVAVGVVAIVQLVF